MIHSHTSESSSTTHTVRTDQTQQALTTTPVRKDITKTLNSHPEIERLLNTDPETGISRLKHELKREFGWEVTKEEITTTLMKTHDTIPLK